MCKMSEDCTLNETVEEIAKDVKELKNSYTDIRKDFELMNKLVNNHDNILQKIDTKVQDSVYTAVGKALDRQEERIGVVVERKLEEQDHKRLKAEEERRKGFMDYGIKSFIGWAVVGLAGVILIVLLGVSTNKNNDLTKDIDKLTSLVESQKEVIDSYYTKITDLQKEVDGMKGGK